MHNRRDFFRMGAMAAAGSGLTAESHPPLGKLKITKFVLHKATLRWRDLLFLEIHTDGGLVGIGEGSLHTRVDLVEEALRWLEPHFVGQDPAGIEDHWDRMYFRLTRWRNGPVLVTALSARGYRAVGPGGQAARRAGVAVARRGVRHETARRTSRTGTRW